MINKLKTLQEFYIIHDKLCTLLKRDTITYHLGIEKIGSKLQMLLLIAKDPDHHGKHAGPSNVGDWLESKDVPEGFSYNMGNIFNDIIDDFIVSKKSNFKDFIMQFNNSDLNTIINPIILTEKLENELGITHTNKKIKI